MRARVALLAGVLFLLPLAYVCSRYDARTHFTSLLYFGSDFDECALPAARAVPRAFAGPIGYDGQFYAQVALDPALRDPRLPRALDNPRYRAGRILVPWLAFLAGAGRPATVLNAYALINLAFFAALLAGLLRVRPPRALRDVLCVAAILWTTGCLVSVRRALVDLPAATFLFYSAVSVGPRAFAALAAAALTREASLLAAAAAVWPQRGGPRNWARALGGGALALAPWLAWTLYVRHVLPPSVEVGRAALGLPGVALGRHVATAFLALRSAPTLSGCFELLAPLSLAVQGVYLLARPRPQEAFWRMGIGFAVLLFLLADGVFAEQIAYPRTVLPLTVAFNLLIVREGSPCRFAAWFVAGNIGLCWAALHMTAEMAGLL